MVWLWCMPSRILVNIGSSIGTMLNGTKTLPEIAFLSIGLLWIKLLEIWIKIQKFSLEKVHFEVSAKCKTSCLGLSDEPFGISELHHAMPSFNQIQGDSDVGNATGLPFYAEMRRAHTWNRCAVTSQGRDEVPLKFHDNKMANFYIIMHVIMKHVRESVANGLWILPGFIFYA